MRILILSLPFAIVATTALAVQVPAPPTPVPTAPAAAVTPATPDPFPAGPGRATTMRVCSGCHAPAVAAGQRMTHEGWTETVETMASRGAMASDAELAEIVDYLSRSFPTPAPASAAPPAK